MSDQKPDAVFEDKIRAALSAPEPDPHFANHLQTRLVSFEGAAPDRENDRRNLTGRITDLFFRPAWKIAVALLLVIAIIILAIGPNRVLADFRDWLGYIPGIGFVEMETQVRWMPEPMEQTRDGITMRLEQVVADDQRTSVDMAVEGIRPEMHPTSEDVVGCSDNPYLLLPDGRKLMFSNYHSDGWSDGYRVHMTLRPIPVEVDQVTFIVPCLWDTLKGTAPENWEFEFVLEPAPEDLQARPAVVVTEEMPTAISTAKPDSETTGTETAPPMTDPHGIHLGITSWVELENSFIFQGYLEWKGTPYDMVYPSTFRMHFEDANGREIVKQTVQLDDFGYPELTQEFPWAVETASKGYASPVTITQSSVSISQDVDLSFDVDLGSNPQPGDIWQLDVSFEVNGTSIRFRQVELEYRDDGSYWLIYTIQTDGNDVSSISMRDPDNPSSSISSMGGPDGDNRLIDGMSYDSQPSGTRHIEITRIDYWLTGPWTVTVDLPPSEAPARDSMPDSLPCVDYEGLWELQEQAAVPVPPGVGGVLLVKGDTQAGEDLPNLYTVHPDGSGRRDLGLTGIEAALSPDGRRVVYRYEDGLYLADINTGKSTPLSWSTDKDYDPIWSPDGEWIAFNRNHPGNREIYITQPDGSGLRQILVAGHDATLADWLPDSSGLLVVYPTIDGDQISTVDIETGEVNGLLMTADRGAYNAKISPDGTRLAYHNEVFGWHSREVVVSNLDGTEQKLMTGLEAIGASIDAWSPNGEWLVLTAHEYSLDSVERTNLLINPDTCQVIRLEYPGSQVVDWVDE